MKVLRSGFLIVASVLFVLSLTGFFTPVTSESEEDREAELKRVQELADSLLPLVSADTGLEIKHGVDIKVVNKKEVREYMIKYLEEENPDQRMEREAKAMELFGLLPEDLDVKALMIDMITEQAGAFYDPKTKTYYAIIDLPPMLKNPLAERTLAAHELVHALQDQHFDLDSKAKEIQDKPDRVYAFRALIEGQATVAMSTIFGADLEKMPDLATSTRASMKMMANSPMFKVFNSAPHYLREWLVSPYADGGSFVQNFLKAHPDAKIADMFERIPVSGEQVLHYEKWEENDLPHTIDISEATALMPEGWTKFYSSNMGELDVLLLGQVTESLKDNAAAIAAGWDGIRYAVYEKDGEMILMGSSIWDSEKDAEEFGAALNEAFLNKYGKSNFALVTEKDRVGFIAGNIEGLPTGTILTKLKASPATE